jgi:hypothetical protein
VLTATVDQLLTNPSTGVMATELVPAAAAFKSMKRANSGLTWVKQKHVTAFLTQLAVAPEISHASLDQLPVSRTRDYVRGLLVERGALPRRDEPPGMKTGRGEHSSASPTLRTATSSAATSAGTTSAG